MIATTITSIEVFAEEKLVSLNMKDVKNGNFRKSAKSVILWPGLFTADDYTLQHKIQEVLMNSSKPAHKIINTLCLLYFKKSEHL